MDRRVQKTRKAILSAFEGLLAEKRYEQITVQNIIDRADIGRSTFYAHFETRDDLLRYTCQELFAHVFDGHPASEISHDFSGEKDSVEILLTHILYHLRDDRARYMRIFSCESADLFWRYFQSQFETFISRYGTREDAARKNVPEDYCMDYYCSSYIESVKWWFRSGLKIAPEELTAYFVRVTG